MRSTAKLDALVTRNISDLEAAMTHVFEVTDKRLFNLLHEIVNEVADTGQWFSFVDAEERELWIAPRSWLVPGTRPVEARAWFEFDELFEEDEQEDDSWLASLTGANSGVAKSAIFFAQEPFGKTAWKKLVKSKPDVLAAILATGMHYSLTEGSFYLPVLIDQEELAAGFENGSPEQAFNPMRAAVRTMVEAAPLFEGFGVGMPAAGTTGDDEASTED